MRTSSAIWIGAITVALLDVAATVEAFRSGHPTLGVITILAAAAAVAVAVTARRPSVTLRGDLAAWTCRTAAATHEAEATIVARAVARHRAALEAERGSDG